MLVHLLIPEIDTHSEETEAAALITGHGALRPDRQISLSQKLYLSVDQGGQLGLEHRSLTIKAEAGLLRCKRGDRPPHPPPRSPCKQRELICSYAFLCLFVLFYHHSVTKEIEVAKLQGGN